ncbi:MAG TPA: adenylate/guanylate cyclase domain-containing protein, partial [Ilumatobacteraceae bacterium]|nr:adenylate/guanylate cyclase domain-containing protein [Ilumatobacteraceae bacterium]
MSGGLVAVAFSDVVSSTELWSRLGDARADDVRRRLHLASEEAVVAVGGTLVKDLGDGVMATFPTASASIEGAVGLQQACASVARQMAVPELQLRVGVSIGEAYREGDDWHGVPVVEAARLAAVADDGQVLVTDAVLLLARQLAHATTPLGTRELKGLPEPVRVTSIDWSPLATSDVALPSFLRRHDGDLPFTGRSAAVQQLRDSFDGAVARHLVLVSGEPGIGKTRLVGEFATEVAERGALVLALAYEEGADVYHRSLGRALRTLAQR